MAATGSGSIRGQCNLLCDACLSTPAAVFCPSDAAALCVACDANVHSANRVVSKHVRVDIWPSQPEERTKCDVCQEACAFFFCREDRALLCQECDVSIHTANALSEKHSRYLLTGMHVSLAADDPDSGDEEDERNGGAGGAEAGSPKAEGRGPHVQGQQQPQPPPQQRAWSTGVGDDMRHHHAPGQQSLTDPARGAGGRSMQGSKALAGGGTSNHNSNSLNSSNNGWLDSPQYMPPQTVPQMGGGAQHLPRFPNAGASSSSSLSAGSSSPSLLGGSQSPQLLVPDLRMGSSLGKGHGMAGGGPSSAGSQGAYPPGGVGGAYGGVGGSRGFGASLSQHGGGGGGDHGAGSAVGHAALDMTVNWRVDEILNIPDLADGYSIGDIDTSKGGDLFDDIDWSVVPEMPASAVGVVPQLGLGDMFGYSGPMERSKSPDSDDGCVVPDARVSMGGPSALDNGTGSNRGLMTQKRQRM